MPHDGIRALQHLRKSVPVKLIGLVGDCRDDDATIFGNRYRGLAAKLIFLVLLALGDAVDARLVKGVDPVRVSEFLG